MHGVWRLDFFYQEGFVSPGQFEGSAFWSLLAVLLTWCALLPTLLAVPLIAKRGRTTTPEWNGKVTFFLHFLLPASLVFSTLFLWAFPHLWGLLPWESFSDDAWKIGPFIGLFTFAGVPTVMVFIELMRLLANPEFASEQPRAPTRHRLETPPPVSSSTLLQVTGSESGTVHFSVEKEHLGHDAWVGGPVRATTIMATAGCGCGTQRTGLGPCSTRPMGRFPFVCSKTAATTG